MVRVLNIRIVRVFSFLFLMNFESVRRVRSLVRVKGIRYLRWKSR